MLLPLNNNSLTEFCINTGGTNYVLP